MTDITLSPRAAFTLRSHNPDVLTCIANLSNDEVFTPPELANQMLDTVADAWAADSGGASIWENPNVTFLDPFTKSGVFLREITSRLTDGLAAQIPDLQERVDHILTKQVYGIGITQLTALLARRSVYCSKDATGKHSVAKTFDRDWGNIWFERTEHTWAGDKCAYCGAAIGAWGRGDELETHAYAFIHTLDIKKRLAQMFGVEVQFDVIVGNPPYQLNTDQADTKITGTIPLYHLFIDQAKRMEPRLLSMIVPARWIAGGRGLDEFRGRMLADRRIRDFVDFPVASEVFGTGVEIGGGVCYFVWDSSYDGPAEVVTVRSGEHSQPSRRDLGRHDVFIRDSEGAQIVDEVAALGEPSVAAIASGQKPFGVSTNFANVKPEREPGDLVLHYVRPGRRLAGHIAGSEVIRGSALIDAWKVFVPEASDGRGTVGFRPAVILGKPIVAGPGEVCTNTYLAIGPFDSEASARSFVSYYTTKFFRFLVSLRKITQHASNFTYTWVPQQSWDQRWTDEELYRKYGLDEGQIEYIESQIKPMTLDDEAADVED
ncbi:MAG: restriction endonuclease [Microbacterium sp. 69-7]|uniref:Eco57I restriction-modification methylase domain-containing protein n=1 Tax=unclassified Microbacterium TaxID=2609290 RepID=UPI00086A352A|nr:MULTISPECIES: Eco57I restriction-modification methylase domain-containing protein [unclassified Microbacterium]ODT21494.1 MAG: restriction endonuclease [Microbacterium sp. SCN 69-37]OJU44234.1 MAG: restriction endonuclease [Microbacterium sp. 69-7]